MRFTDRRQVIGYSEPYIRLRVFGASDLLYCVRGRSGCIVQSQVYAFNRTIDIDTTILKTSFLLWPSKQY